MSAAPARKHLIMLDGIRGIAALIVVFCHLGNAIGLGEYNPHTYLAVEYFFLLSGFVLAYAYDGRWAKGMTTWEFFKRRLVRLHPLVPVAVLLGLVATLFTDAASLGSRGQIALWAAGCLLMIPALSSPLLNPFNGPVWTLYYEYFANILYALVLRRIGRRTLIALTAVAACASVLVGLRIDLFGLLLNHGYTLMSGWGTSGAHFYCATTRLAFPLLAGLLICRSGWKIRIPHAFWPTAAVFAALLLWPVFPGEVPWRGGLANGIYELGVLFIAMPLVLMIGVGDETDPESRTAKFARFFGDISFPLYMTHYPFTHLIHFFVKEHHVALTCADKVLVSVGFYAFALALAYVAKRFWADPVVAKKRHSRL